MTIGATTITTYKGEDVTLSFGPMSPLVDISGWTINFSVVGPSSTEIISILAVVTDGPAGTYTVALADTHTEGLATGTYRYSCWREDDGTERPIAIGDFVVNDGARV